MEPQFSVLVYSKFSQSCKQLISIIEQVQQNGLDFMSATGLQTLCIDNDKVRKRILNNPDIDVQKVPCILVVYSNGNVEKYDGGFAFNWVSAALQQITPPPAEPQPKPVKDPAELVEPVEPVEPSIATVSSPKKNKKRPKMRPINSESKTGGKTSILDLPVESDRNVTIPGPKRIRQGEHEYVEDDELFRGDQTDFRREPPRAIRDTSNPTQEDPHGTMAMMREIEKERQAMDDRINPPTQRPTESRRP